MKGTVIGYRWIDKHCTAPEFEQHNKNSTWIILVPSPLSSLKEVAKNPQLRFEH